MVNILKKKHEKRIGSVLTTFAIATFSLQILVLLLFIIQGLNIRQLSLRKPPNFVQMVDGQTVGAIDDLERDPETILRFVSKTMVAMFNWSGKLPPQSIEEVAKPKPDKGIQVRNRNVTTSTWIASFAISEDFRQGFLSAIADLTPPEVFNNNPSQSITAQLIIKRLYPPEKIAPGKWRVGMVADLIQTKRSDNRRRVTSFNKDLLVRAIDYYPYPLSENSTDLQKAIYNTRTDKLEIYEIRNLCLLDEYGNQQDKTGQCLNRRPRSSFLR
ncbi:hypothetical protein H6G76_01785 [Nostoc sp. FACHB-152]|uniref:hypothetical protein n=1 Tax=unclassified Nostoc TaxID=2593658 RepID=UPI001684EFB6|nr:MULTISPECIES: hypothetical protein [unclassified Nostoc]MBD2445903.1 hypothetical protein [Nostoc sp. FACHB-152]MBD2467921.1 hypothetical protein [Nostoc sp. FACHB-145]